MIYSSKTAELKQILSQFYASDKYWPVWLLSYETLSPDSCIWLLANSFPEIENPKKRYALYLEDFVPSLQHVKDKVIEHTKAKKVKLLPVLRPQVFETSTPVSTATTYQPPEDQDFMNYAAEISYYFVFLVEYEQ